MLYYSQLALAGAFDEITLVLFTTLAPSGTLAFVLMALPLIVKGDAIEEDTARRVEKHLCLPVLCALVGLVASTTHLGNPANALYVLTGFGRSPLSTEVVFGVLFLGAGSIYWLASFAEKRHPLIARRIGLCVTTVFALAFIGAMSLAYDAETIITWSNPYVPAALWLNSFVGGPLLAILGLRLARFFTKGHCYGKALIALSAIALATNTLLYALWHGYLSGLSNSLTSAEAIAIPFIPALLCFLLLCATGVALDAKAVRMQGETPLWMPIASVICAFCGIFVMRLSFYAIYMTVGLGLGL